MPVRRLIFRESLEERLIYHSRSTANLQFRSDDGGHSFRRDAPGGAIDAGAGIGNRRRLAGGHLLLV